MPPLVAKPKTTEPDGYREIVVEALYHNGRGKRQQVEAYVIGGVVGVHPRITQAPSQSKDYTVTAVKCGQVLTHQDNLDDALLVAETLKDLCPVSLSIADPDRARAALPPWVEPWCKALLRNLRYLDPTPFRRQYKVKLRSK